MSPQIYGFNIDNGLLPIVFKVIGPVIVLTQAPSVILQITVTLQQDYLVAEWTDGTFVDVEFNYLKYTFSLGELIVFIFILIQVHCIK